MRVLLSVISFITLLNISCIIAAHKADTVTAICITPDNLVEQTALLEKQFAQPCLVEQITYDTDVKFCSEEFFYLLGFTSGAVISVDHMRSALYYFFKKNKFTEINIKITSSCSGMLLHFSFTSLWTVERVKIKGILFDKDKYRHLYLIEPGEPFDEKKHAHSLAKITESLVSEGYCSAKVTSDFSRDNRTKNVVIKLVIERGGRYKIGIPQVNIAADEIINPQEVSRFREYVRVYLSKELNKAYYHKSELNKIADTLGEYAAEQGFLQIAIKCTEHTNHTMQQVDITWHIELNNKRRLVFCGNSFFSHKQLLDICLNFARCVWLLPASMIAQELVRVYKRAGFWSVSVEPREETDRYFFLISEGQQATINTIEINNVTFLDSKTLVKRYFSQFRKKAVADEQQLDASFDALTTFLGNSIERFLRQ